jgi:hypothetical protein
MQSQKRKSLPRKIFSHLANGQQDLFSQQTMKSFHFIKEITLHKRDTQRKIENDEQYELDVDFASIFFKNSVSS